MYRNNTAHISPEKLGKSFTKCCISSAMDETDIDMLWNGSEEGGNVSIEEGKDCEDGEGDTDG